MSKYDHDSKMGESVSRDRLSELPNILIVHILSFLQMRDVVSTTLISKHFNNLWTSVPCLNFREFIDDEEKERVRNFINRALIMWNGTTIQKFKISIHDLVDSSLAADMDRWVHFAVKKRVQEFKIYLTYGDDEIVDENVYCIPRWLKSCSSLRKLSVVGCNFRMKGSPRWNQLKNLKLDCFRLKEQLVNTVLLGCPRLEAFELRLMESEDNLNIMSTSLKKLTIERYTYFEWEYESLYTVLRICCPNLEILEFSGGSYGKCSFSNVSFLIDATLNFEMDIGCDIEALCLDEMFEEPLSQVFSTQAEKVSLSDLCVYGCLQVFDASPKKRLLAPNVKFLTFDGYRIDELGPMMYMLGIFPNLKVLVIEDLERFLPTFYNPEKFVEFERNTFVLLQLTTVEITWGITSDFPIFGFIEFFLKRAVRLEKLVLHLGGITSYGKMFLISRKLLGMRRSSPTAEVIIKCRIE